LLVHKATGVSKSTIAKGKRELNKVTDASADNKNHVRASGGGRKSITEKYPNLLTDFDELIEPATRGEPENPLRWSSKSTTKLANVLS
jgi:hypothetical protein